MAIFITELTPPADNNFKYYATYISGTTFTAPADGWYRFHVIGAGGDGGTGEGGDSLLGSQSGGLHFGHGRASGGGGSGGVGIITAYMKKGETAVITVGTATVLTIGGRTVTAAKGSISMNYNPGGGGGASGGDKNTSGNTGGSPSIGSSSLETSTGGTGGNGATNPSKYGGPGGVGGAAGVGFNSTGGDGGDAIAVTSGAGTRLGGGGGGGGGAAARRYRDDPYTYGGAAGAGAPGGVVVEQVINSAPKPPTSFSFPDSIRGGESFAISWSGATDADGNLQGYILERSTNGGGTWTQRYQGTLASTTDIIPIDTATGVSYRVKAYDTYGLESAWFTSSTRTVTNNTAPTTPPSITVPLNVMSGVPLMISWAASTDVDGDLMGYRLERSINSGSFTRIYEGPALTFTDTIEVGWNTVQYRVKAYDSYDFESGYATASVRSVVSNSAPVITSDFFGNLGEKNSGFTVTYKVTDADGDQVTVREVMDGIEKRSYIAVLGATNTFDVSGMYFMKVLNGSHTIQIIATDSKGKSATLALTFSKAVHACRITLETPLTSANTLKKMIMNVARSIPSGAEFKALATNNANDPVPVWEDVTAKVIAGGNVTFDNETAENGYAFNFIITANRNSASQGGYIVSIGGALGGMARNMLQSAILLASGWSNNSQTVNVYGVMASGQVVLPSPATASDADAWAAAGVFCSAQSANALTFICDTPPAADIAVNIALINNAS